VDSTSSQTVTKPPSMRRLWAPILGIGLTQMIGWGTSFTALTVLGTQIGRDLAMSREAIFGALSIMLLVSAVIAPRVGRFIDAEGARDLMLPGTLIGAVALLVVAASQGPWSFWFGWALFGLTVAMMLNNASVPALVQIAGTDSRRAVSAFTIVTGVTSAIFLPLTDWLAARYGWRHTMLLFSLMYIVICLPVLLLVLPHAKPERPIATASSSNDVSWEGILPTAWRRTGFWLAALWMAMQGLIAWGFNVQVIDILSGVVALALLDRLIKTVGVEAIVNK
jgi:predicted MFS family arabinose efflux permease